MSETALELASETPLDEQVKRALDLMASGEHHLILEHPAPSIGTYHFPPAVAKAVVASLAAVTKERDEARAEVESLKWRLTTAYQVKYNCNEDANFERHERLAATALATTLSEENARLREALTATLDKYVGIVNSFWNPEEEPHVIASRAALQREQGR